MTGVKFNFDNDFEADKERQAEEEAVALELRLEETRAAGYQEGVAAGRAEARAETERHLTEVLQTAVTRIDDLAARRKELEDRLEGDAVQLALIIARKLASAALDKHPAAEIEGMIRECFEVAREEAKLVVRVAEDLVESVASRCDEIRSRSSFVGEVIVIGDPGMARNDCVVEWPDGGAEHRIETVSTAIERRIQDFIFGRSMTAAGAKPSSGGNLGAGGEGPGSVPGEDPPQQAELDQNTELPEPADAAG